MQRIQKGDSSPNKSYCTVLKYIHRTQGQQILSHCLGLQTQNPRLREVDLEPSPKRGSDKINMLKHGRNTEKKASCIIQPGLTYGSKYLER